MTFKYIWRSFQPIGCHFHVRFSNLWPAFASRGLPAIPELFVHSASACLWPKNTPKMRDPAAELMTLQQSAREGKLPPHTLHHPTISAPASLWSSRPTMQKYKHSNTSVKVFKWQILLVSVLISKTKLRQESPAGARVTRDSAVIPRWRLFQDGRQLPSWMLSNRK